MNNSNLNNVLELAIQIAVESHKGQVDRSGLPYILHPLTVMTTLDTLEEKILGVLHDVIEDTEQTPETLIDKGIPKYLVDWLLFLTHNEEDTYYEYIDKILDSGVLAILNVKLKDVAHNSDAKRLPTITEKDSSRMRKYANTKLKLEAKIREMRFYTHDSHSQTSQ